MKKKKMVIFDFDGTIADTIHLGLQISNELAGEFNFKTIAKEDVKNLREYSSHEILKKMKISLVKVPFIALKFQRELSKRIDELRPIDGMIDLIKKLSDLKIKIGILTSNSKENVERFLENYKLDNVFSFIHSERNIFGKTIVLKKTLWEQKYKPSEVFYIGDETRDIDSAKKAHISIIAVGWGLNSEKALLKHNPEYLVSNPSELLDKIKSLI
ncbi:MAG: HAD hydrolase-like protein [Candidatus Cloacimonadota bacterium]|nr:HAD hydrolase-like protein [Candidatus Cloacimonadota bacterium]